MIEYIFIEAFSAEPTFNVSESPSSASLLKSASILIVPVPVNLPISCPVIFPSAPMPSFKSRMPLFILSVPSILAPSTKDSSEFMLVVPVPDIVLSRVPESSSSELFAIVPRRFPAVDVSLPPVISTA